MKKQYARRPVADPLAALARAYDFILSWPAPTTATVTLEPTEPAATPTPAPEPATAHTPATTDAHE